jgi:UPF0271 protein
MKSIDLNCDLGEGFENDGEIMPFISSANIACGAHAGNHDTMKQTIELAMQHGVKVGAHPGFADKINFGRIELPVTEEEVYALVTEQILSLEKIASDVQCELHHVKPHGALYNMAAKDKSLATAIARATKDVNSNLILYGLSGSFLISEGKSLGLKTASEVFADRTYDDNGNLMPRSQPGALITTDEEAINQVLNLVHEQMVTSVKGNKVAVLAETFCIHGDGEYAVSFAQKIFSTLKQHHIEIKPV